MLRPFSYYAPATIAEASSLLLEHAPHAHLLAGGTQLLVALERRQLTAKVVVDLRVIQALREVTFSKDEGLRLGALVTLAELQESAAVSHHYPALLQAARFVATPQVQRLATVGGNLCSGLPAADLFVMLLALDASVETWGPDGARILPLAALMTPWGSVALEPGEIVLAVRVPPLRGNAGYRRLMVRSAADVPLVNVAAAVDLASTSSRTPAPVIHNARIAIGASGPRPLRLPRAELFLKGRSLDEQAITGARALIMEDSFPADDERASRRYRRFMLGALTADILGELCRQQ